MRKVKNNIFLFPGPPKIKRPYIQYGIEGEAVKVECLIESVPQPSKIMWSHNSKVCTVILSC